MMTDDAVTIIAPRPGFDWTDAERTEIGRLEKICNASKNWLLECSYTDAGDPWCIIYDHDQQSIILHIARIDRQYVIVWPREQRSETSPIMTVAIEIALEGLKLYQRCAS